MHVEGPQICQINNSFQNMYGMKRQQLTVWQGKLILCKKKNTTFSPILVDIYLTLEGPGRKNRLHQVNFWCGPENFGA